jgi:membrane protein DedA with SNARE-associated domain
MDPAPILGLAALILVKEMGVPVPVPGDLLIIGAGAAAARGDLDGTTMLAAIIAASVVGGAIQFGLLSSVARARVLGLLSRFAGADRIDAQAARLRGSGARRVALARMTPGVRIPVIPACALAAVPAPAFLAGLAVGNGLFIAAHFGLGYLVGEEVAATVTAFLVPILVGVVALAVVGAIVWTVVAHRRRRATTLATEAAWADACCPACLIATVVKGWGPGESASAV